MRTIIHHRARSHATRDHGTAGFILWIAAYAAFMLILIAFSGSQHLIRPMLSWPAFPGFG